MTLLAIRGLRKSYTQHLIDGRRIDVLRGVDIDVEPGECVVLTGVSGSGKSTLLRCAYRSALADAGSIRLRAGSFDVDLAGAADREVLAIRRQAVGLATQFLDVVPRVAAIDLVASVGGDIAGAADLLGRLGLSPELFAVPPATFSGGQRQIVNLALALARRRPLLLLDEVTASLDRGRRQGVLSELIDRKRAGVGMLAVFHDVPAVRGLVDRVVLLRDGLVAA